jgi:conjugative relaxase-like TrwC/TraI family protein
MTQAPGRWLADAETLERLGIHAGEPVDGADFIALMEGRHPGTGRWLRPEGAGGGRGGGIDVTFSAPKSVSTVWGLGDPWQREQIEQAHARAVEHTIHHLREQVPVVRRRYSGQVVEEHAKDVIATEYRHTTARGVQGAQAPDPQLHSHVVITGAVREDDRIVAVASRPIFRNARELGAFYRSALADELVRDGYAIEQGTGKDGRYFEIAGVPRELCEAFSGPGRMTTLAVRAQEQAIERRARQLAQPAGRDVGDVARENAAREAAEPSSTRPGPPHHGTDAASGPYCYLFATKSSPEAGESRSLEPISAMGDTGLEPQPPACKPPLRQSPAKSGPMWYSPAVLSAKTEYQSSTTYDPKTANFQVLSQVEPTGIEPVTSCLQSRRSPS